MTHAFLREKSRLVSTSNNSHSIRSAPTCSCQGVSTSFSENTRGQQNKATSDWNEHGRLQRVSSILRSTRKAVSCLRASSTVHLPPDHAAVGEAVRDASAGPQLNDLRFAQMTAKCNMKRFSFRILGVFISSRAQQVMLKRRVLSGASRAFRKQASFAVHAQSKGPATVLGRPVEVRR